MPSVGALGCGLVMRYFRQPILLGYIIAGWDAFEEGETLLPDLVRSGFGAMVAALVFGSITTYTSIGTAILIGLGIAFAIQIHNRVEVEVVLDKEEQPIAETLANLALALFAAAIIMFSLVLFSSTVIYFLERHVQPDVFGSVPSAAWWAIATLTTVGYGDVTPVTHLGRVFGGFVMIFGTLISMLPALKTRRTEVV